MTLWTEDLTDAQLKMLMCSTVEKYGVEIRGGGWATARSLERHGLGGIDGDPGSELPALFFANDEGVRILREFEDEDEEGCPYCGLTRSHSHYF